MGSFARRASPGEGAIGEGGQEGHDVVDVSLAQGRCGAGFSAEWGFLIDVGLKGGRQIVEFLNFAVGIAWVPFRRIGVAAGIECHGLFQAVEHAVVKEHLPQGHVAQRRGFEQAAIRRVVGEILAFRPAQAEVVEFRIFIGGNRGIAGNAEGDEAVVGELRRRTVSPARAGVAMRAIAAGGIVERGETAGFLCCQLRAACEEIVIFAAVGVEQCFARRFPALPEWRRRRGRRR